MYQLYEVLYKWPEPPTTEEEEIASGKRTLDNDASHQYLSQLEKASENIVKALEKQAAKVLVCACSYAYISLLTNTNRAIGIRQNLNAFLLNGSLCAINHLKKLNIHNFGSSLITCTTLASHCIFLGEVRCNEESWRWARNIKKIFERCLRYGRFLHWMFFCRVFW